MMFQLERQSKRAPDSYPTIFGLLCSKISIVGLVAIAMSFLIAFPNDLFAQNGNESKKLNNTKPLKVFILAGQSNMEGKGSVFTMQRQLEDPEKKVRFQHLKSDSTEGSQFIERDDVFISYLGNHGIRNGKLTIGYGVSREGDEKLFGPELGFGWAVGDHFEEDVLIIKTAWGGKSLDCDFRPPSREIPDSISVRLENAKKRNPEVTLEEVEKQYGHFYREMIQHVKTVLDDIETYAPGNESYELAGFVWFQGFNDQFAPTSVEDYEENLIALIKDLRKDLNSPNLPIVIGAMGHEGQDQKGKVKQIADAQAATATHAEFQDGSVVTIRTADHWDEEADEAFQKYWADEPNRDVDKWKTFGNDRPYHYLGSPKFFLEVGDAFGKALLELQNE